MQRGLRHVTLNLDTVYGKNWARAWELRLRYGGAVVYEHSNN